jgi:hypothetical protein
VLTTLLSLSFGEVFVSDWVGPSFVGGQKVTSSSMSASDYPTLNSLQIPAHMFGVSRGRSQQSKGVAVSQSLAAAAAAANDDEGDASYSGSKKKRKKESRS